MGGLLEECLRHESTRRWGKRELEYNLSNAVLAYFITFIWAKIYSVIQKFHVKEPNPRSILAQSLICLPDSLKTTLAGYNPRWPETQHRYITCVRNYGSGWKYGKLRYRDKEMKGIQCRREKST